MSELIAMKTFCDDIQKLIELRGLSVRSAAALIGMDNSNLSKILRGKERLTFDRAERIANALGGSLKVTLEINSEKLAV